MTRQLKKVWLWVKLGAIVLVSVWVGMFLIKNYPHRTDVWLFFGLNEHNASLSVIIPITAAVSIVVFYVVRKVTTVLHQLSEIREQEKTKERERRMEDLARQVERKLPSSQGKSDNEA